MALLCELTTFFDVLQRDDSVLIFRLFVAIQQLVKVAIAFGQQSAASLMDFFDNGIDDHIRGPSSERRR